jgi:hypothetical protein
MRKRKTERQRDKDRDYYINRHIFTNYETIRKDLEIEIQREMERERIK